MNVLYISSVDSSVKAGYYYSVIDRINELKKNNDNVEVISINFDRAEKRGGSFFSSNVYLPRIFNSKIPFLFFTEIYMLIRLLWLSRGEDIDIIHVHWCYPVGFSASLLSKFLMVPFVLTCHGSDIHTHPSRNYLIYSRTRAVLKAASKIFCVSYSLKNELLRRFDYIDEKNVLVSYNGVSLPSTLNNKKVLPLIRVLYVGNLNYVKGADRLPYIFEEIRLKTNFNVCFTVVGCGELFENLKTNPLSLKNKVDFVGMLDRTAVLGLMKDSDLVIMPSRKEGFGLVALESLMLGTPCLAYDLEVLREVFIYNSEFLSKDEAELTDKAKAILDKISDDFSIPTEKYKIYFNLHNAVQSEVSVYETILKF